MAAFRGPNRASIPAPKKRLETLPQRVSLVPKFDTRSIL
jgi:hypothetical protein